MGMCHFFLTHAVPVLLVLTHLLAHMDMLIYTRPSTLPFFVTSLNTYGINHCMQTREVTYLAPVLFLLCQNASLCILHISSGVTLSASNNPQKCLNPL